MTLLKVSVITDVILAVVPIVAFLFAFLFAFQFFVVKKPIEDISHILIGIALHLEPEKE